MTNEVSRKSNQIKELECTVDVIRWHEKAGPRRDGGSSDATIINADRKYRVPVVPGRRQAEAHRGAGSSRCQGFRTSCPAFGRGGLPAAPPRTQPRPPTRLGSL